MHARADAHPLPGFLAVHADGLTLAVKVTPRAPHDEIVPPGDNDRELRVKVTAPPVDAAANEALLRLLAEKLDCPRGAVQLLRGLTSRHKVVKLRGRSTAVVLAKLSDAK